MFTRTLKALLGVLIISLIFTACGELDTVFSPGGTTYYRVNAAVNKSTLYEYSIIKKGDKIYPYFVNSVHNDPDILGLTVFLETPSGKIIGPKVQYIRKAEENQTESIYTPEPLPETGLPEPASPVTEPGEPDITEPLPEETSLTEPETAGILPEESQPETVSPEPVFPEPAQPGLVPPSPLPAEPAAPEPVQQPEQVPPMPDQPEPALPEPVQEEISEPAVPPEDLPEVPVEGLLPEFPLEETPEEPSGDEELTEEPVPEEKPPEKPVPAVEIREIPLFENLVYPVVNLDWQLPAFPLPEILEIGQYVMVFQVIGVQNALYEIDLPFYFLGDAVFALDDIRSHLPSVSPGNYLISAGEYILLEALIDSDPRLNPYLVWYSNKKRIGEGYLTDGANYLFWEAPEKTGFQSISVEVFPFLPDAQIKGMIKELSLPVSKKNANRGAFSQSAAQYALWYRFEGNLSNAQSPADSLKFLVPQENRAPQWLPWAGIYGLSIGPEDVYHLPGSPFRLNGEEQGKGRLIFRVKLLAEGTIFKAVFRESRTSSDALDLNLSYRRNALTLVITEKFRTQNSTEEAKTYTETIGLHAGLTEDFIVFFIDFDIRKNRFIFQMGLENTGMASGEKVIPLTSSLSGLGVFQFGESLPLTSRRNERSALYGANARRPVFILDELGVLYTRKPAVDEEETPAAEDLDLTAETENPETA
jgi:hypothetical protein